MTPKITAHYCELTWFRPWFHLVPHVGKNDKSQLTIGNWFGSWFGSTWFRSCEKECCEEPLPTMYWGSVGLMGRLRKKCFAFSHQHRKPNVNWISSLSVSACPHLANWPPWDVAKLLFQLQQLSSFSVIIAAIYDNVISKTRSSCQRKSRKSCCEAKIGIVKDRYVFRT